MFKKLPNALKLSREAILYDSKLYILKAVLAIATGYLVGSTVPIARIDIISVLLGVMYNLEPINILGIRGGIDQLLASTIGAACTGLLIFFFGINVFTIAAAMGLTLYVALKINWRMVSPVAIFTCIYMTQCVQLDAVGNPSIWLTFRVRILALGLGVLIAIVFNYATSFFYYRKIAFKRLKFAKMQLIGGIEYLEEQLSTIDKSMGRDYITVYPNIFKDLDSVYKVIETMLNESKYAINLLKPEKLRKILKLLQYFRDINHVLYDISFEISRNEIDEFETKEILGKIQAFKNSLKTIDLSYHKESDNRVVQQIQTDKKSKESIHSVCKSRNDMNLDLIEEYRKCIIAEAIGL